MTSATNELLPDVIAKQTLLSQQGKKQIKEISGPRPARFLLEAFSAWLVIFAAIAIAVTVNNFFVSCLAIVVVATRQNVFALLIHEQAHHLAFNNKFGDLIVNCLVAYPLLLMKVEDYAELHLSHHKFFFTEKDPDHLRKNGDDWALPISRQRLLKLLMSDLCGLSVWRFYQGKKMAKKMNRKKIFRRRMDIPVWVKPAYLAIVAGIITWAQAWDIFLIYWALPLCTVFQVIIRWGALCEHVYNLPQADVEDCTPMIIVSPLEKFLLPNLNFNYHLYHHYFPGISFSQLPKAHQIFVEEGLVKAENIFFGYKSMLKYFLTTQHPNRTAADKYSPISRTN